MSENSKGCREESEDESNNMKDEGVGEPSDSDLWDLDLRIIISN